MGALVTNLAHTSGTWYIVMVFFKKKGLLFVIFADSLWDLRYNLKTIITRIIIYMYYWTGYKDPTFVTCVFLLLLFVNMFWTYTCNQQESQLPKYALKWIRLTSWTVPQNVNTKPGDSTADPVFEFTQTEISFELEIRDSLFRNYYFWKSN